MAVSTEKLRPSSGKGIICQELSSLCSLHLSFCLSALFLNLNSFFWWFSGRVSVCLKFVYTCVILYVHQNSNCTPDDHAFVSPEPLLVMLLCCFLFFFSFSKAKKPFLDKMSFVTAVSISSHVCLKLAIWLLMRNSVAAVRTMVFIFSIFFARMPANGIDLHLVFQRSR